MSISKDELRAVLKSAEVAAIAVLIRKHLLDELIPGIRRLATCNQGNQGHLEGAAHIHTALVVGHMRELSRLDHCCEFDDVDLFAALIHDLEKPATRREWPDGSVTFVGHESLGAVRVPGIADRLGLTFQQQAKLLFLVREHGRAHDLQSLCIEVQKLLVLSPYWRNLRLLQSAATASCWLNGAGTQSLPSQWSEFCRLRHLHGKNAPT